jgi:hypothetical protein
LKTEAASIGEFRSWSSCTVPLSVVANREHYADGHQEIWFLIDTQEVQDPSQTRQEYHLRPSTEERYRQPFKFVSLRLDKKGDRPLFGFCWFIWFIWFLGFTAQKSYQSFWRVACFAFNPRRIS